MLAPQRFIRGRRKAPGGIDILVNNAGGESSGGGPAPWLEATPHDCEALQFQRRVDGASHQARRARDEGARLGRIINLSSVSVDMPMTVIPDYQAAKAAVRTLTRSLAATLAHTGITVNSISPGLTHSTGPERWLRGIAQAQGWSDDWADIPAIVERDLIKNFTGRMGEPADIAHAVAFLADPRGGQANAIDIVIDGGH
jgi:NAD(P)-dependent dehydrogenase (short-subunit alcohol dehydrogenase family)